MGYREGWLHLGSIPPRGKGEGEGWLHLGSIPPRGKWEGFGISLSSLDRLRGRKLNITFPSDKLDSSFLSLIAFHAYLFSR